MPKIFGLAEERAKAIGARPAPVAPGLLTRMIIDASVSEDHEDLNDWWANIFLDASLSGSNRHAVFSDMMAFIGPKEAEVLRGFIDGFSFSRDRSWLDQDSPIRSSIGLTVGQGVANFIGETPVTPERWSAVRNNLLRGELGWPVRATSWRLPGKNEADESVWLNQNNPWFAAYLTEIEILERTRVFKVSRVDIPVMGPATWVDVVELTALGADFYRACTMNEDFK